MSVSGAATDTETRSLLSTGARLTSADIPGPATPATRPGPGRHLIIVMYFGLPQIMNKPGRARDLIIREIISLDCDTGDDTPGHQTSDGGELADSGG